MYLCWLSCQIRNLMRLLTAAAVAAATSSYPLLFSSLTLRIDFHFALFTFVGDVT